MNKFSKKTFITILTIITIVCVLLGIVLHVILPMYKNDLHIKSSSNSISEVYDIPDEEITEISINGKVVELVIKSDSEESNISCSYEGDERLMPEMSVSDGVLTFTQRGSNINNWINIEGPRLTITINPDINLDMLNLDVDAGDIEISNSNSINMTIDVDAGNVEVYNGSFDNITVVCDAGNIEFHDTVFNNFDGSCDMGNIEINGIDSSLYSINAEVELGDIRINNSTYGSPYHSNTDSENVINLNVDMGEASINN